MLLDYIVNTSLRSLALGSLLCLLLPFLLTSAGSFLICGGQTCTGTRTFSLAWW